MITTKFSTGQKYEIIHSSLIIQWKILIPMVLVVYVNTLTVSSV